MTTSLPIDTQEDELRERIATICRGQLTEPEEGDLLALIATNIKAAETRLLEELYLKSEVIGVGYAIVRESHITDRLAQLNSKEITDNE